MQIHLFAQDDDMWYIITDGPMKILKVNTVVAISGGEPQMQDQDLFNRQGNLGELTQLCEDNDQTKENKITVAIQKFDNAKMKPGETMAEFDEKFSNIVCEIISLGKIYSNREISLKVMRALPREWDVKTTSISESKDLSKMELHDFFADLKAYEFELGIRTEEEPSTSNPTKALTSTAVPQPIEKASAKKTAEQM
ncbi:uncharacterized protein [Henckelia pumila]|uniref:uncharacterized protein n=1 Tax=Henckelia pumila TaxID=405737 RepID=UPI003C6DFBBA